MPQSLYIHHNCYAMLEEVRTDLNEYNTALVQGSEVGAYDNSDIVRKINQAQKYIWGLLFQRYPEMFLTSADVTGSSGSYTVPSDLYRLSHIINSDGENISPISVKIKHASGSGNDYLYYRYGNTIVRDGGGSDALTFYYYKTVKELTQGITSAGGLKSMTLATTAKPVADYYNGLTIESITGGWDDVISDYSAVRVATIVTNTSASSQYYGTVSELPEPFHHLISRRATLMLKNSVTSPQDNKATEMSDFREDLIETLRSYAGTREDVPLSEVFYSFEPFY